MNAFLIGLSWCDPEEVRAYVCAGLDDDPRCSTGLFIMAEDEAAALSWGNEVSQKYLGFLFAEKNYQPEQLEVHCWVEADPQDCSWAHCLDFFQRVQVGQVPEFPKMTAEAYLNWCKNAGIA
jgi:hypothetical protein